MIQVRNEKPFTKIEQLVYSRNYNICYHWLLYLTIYSASRHFHPLKLVLDKNELYDYSTDRISYCVTLVFFL